MATIPRSPVDLLRLLVENASWFPSALELDGVNGEALLPEAEASIAAFAAQFQSGVAYMPVPRCDQCKWWDPNAATWRGSPWGRCRLISVSATNPQHLKVLAETTTDDMRDGELDTAPDFGCVHWEAK